MSRRSVEEQRFDFDEAEEEEPDLEPSDSPSTLSEASVSKATVASPRVEDEDGDARSTVISAAELRARLDSLRQVARQSSVAQRAREVDHPVIARSRTLTLSEQDCEIDTADVTVSANHWDEEQSDKEEPVSLSIAEFYERMRRALAGEFSDDVWVLGEIRSIREARGHHYLELADHGAPASGRDAGETLEVACWARDWPRVARALSAVDLRLEVGQVVRVRGKVSVWAGRIRFTLHALDVEALLGQIAQARRKLLHALELEGLLDANKKWPVPLVPLRIGLVTSHSSEAHRDFVGQLEQSGFCFQVHLEASFVQGAEAPGQLAAALRRLEIFEPDLAVIVRGGGGRGDLAAFDAEEVARAVANSSFPIWTGIGHTGDRSVVDEIAHSSFITPTACGEAIVARVATYWSDIVARTAMLTSLASARLDGATQRLANAEKTIVRGTRHQLVVHESALVSARSHLARATDGLLRAEAQRLAERSRRIVVGTARSIDRPTTSLERCAQVLRAYDPKRQLARGWTLTKDASGNIVKSAAGLRAGARVTTRFVDGEAHSVIEQIDVLEREGDD